MFCENNDILQNNLHIQYELCIIPQIIVSPT